MKQKELHKGCLEPILLKLLQDNGRMYGYEITQKVRLLTKGEINITEGALYPLLHRLESDDIIYCEIEMINNRSRKYYQLTPKGKLQETEGTVALAKFVESISAILQPTLKPNLQ